MSDCGSSADVCNIAEHASKHEHCPDDPEFMAKQLIEFLDPEIDHIIAILRKLQLPLDGIMTLGEEVESARLEDEEEEKDKDEEEEWEEEEVEEQTADGRQWTLALIRLCRLDVEKSSTEEEATLHVAVIQVLEQLEMNEAVDCLRRIANVWRKQAKEHSASSGAGQTQIPATQVSPGEGPLRCHRTVLRETLATLVDRLAITDTLLSILMKKSVINQHMVTLVSGRPNRQQQVVQLIELLTQLGPYSLQVFIEALTETGNIALTNVLKWSLRHAPLDIDI